VTGIDFEPFSISHPAMWKQMTALGWDSVEALRDPRYPGTNSRGFAAFWELQGVGARKILDLVNFLRDNRVELPWFAEWDALGDQNGYLAGCRRTAPCQEL
jgi:hypothetical protein